MAGKPAFKVGDYVTFSGYADLSDPDNGELQPGQVLRIEQDADADGAYVTIPVDADTREPTGSATAYESVFEQEIRKSSAKALAAESNSNKKSTTAQATASLKHGTSTHFVQKPSPILPGGLSEGGGAMPDTLILTAEVKAAMSGGDVLESIDKLAVKHEENLFTLGGLLAITKRDALYLARKFEGKRAWQDYCDTTLPFSYRMVQYYISMYEGFTAAGMDNTHIRAMGWSKAKEISRIGRIKAKEPGQLSGPELLKRDRTLLLDKARSLTRDELADYIKVEYMQAQLPGEIAGAAKVRKAFGVKLWPDQQANVFRAIDAAKQAAGTKDADAALNLIALEWAQAHDGVEVPLEDAIRVLEMRYNVSVSVGKAVKDKAA